MAKNEKAKTGKSRNDDRKNGKASKNPDGRRHRKNHQDDIALVLLGKGLYRQVRDRTERDKQKTAAAKRRSKDSED